MGKGLKYVLTSKETTSEFCIRPRRPFRFHNPTFHYYTFGFSLFAPVHFDRNHPLNLIQAIIFRLCTFNPLSVYPDLSFGFRYLDLLTFERFGTSHYEQYVSTRKWPNSKKKQWLRQAGSALDEQNWPFVNPYKAYKHDIFIKDEFYLDPQKAPRIICNAQPLIKGVHATALFQASEVFFHSKYSVKHVAEKWKEVEERLGKAKFYIGMDCSSWECSMNFYYQLIFCLYVSRFPNAEPFILSVLRHTSSRGMMELKHRLITAHIPLCRMSGDYETSFGNSVINFLLVSSYFRTDRVIVEGDDAIVAVDSYPDTLEKDFKAFGFRLTPVIADHPGKVGFCSMFWDDRGPYREPEKFYRGLLVNSFTGLSRPELQAAKLRSADYNFPGNPVIIELCKRHPGNYRLMPFDAYHPLEPGSRPMGKFQLVPHKVSKPDYAAYLMRFGFLPSTKGDDVRMIENVLISHGFQPNFNPECGVQMFDFPLPDFGSKTVIPNFDSQYNIHIQHGENFKTNFKTLWKSYKKKGWTCPAIDSYFDGS